MLSPENSLLLEYGPPTIFAGVVLYLLIGHKERSRTEMLSIAMMIAGVLLAIGGLLLYKGEMGRFPLADDQEKDRKLETVPAESLTASVYIDCVMASWDEAEKAPNTEALIGNYSAMSFGQPKYGFGFGTGPILAANHRSPSASSQPIKCVMTFYAKEPILNFEAKIEFISYKPVRSDNRVTLEEMPFKSDHDFVRIKQVRKDLQYVFYVYSFDVDIGIKVRFPDSFSFNTPRSAALKVGKVIRPTQPFQFDTAMPAIKIEQSKP